MEGRGPVPEELERIREILVGPQARENEERAARLEKRLTAEVEGTRREIQQRFEALETSLREEVKALTQRLEVEGAHRSQSMEELSAGLSERLGALAGEFEEKVAQMLDRVAQREHELQAEIAKESQAVREEQQRAVDELQEAKVNGNRLATLVADFARRLNQEVQDGTVQESTGLRTGDSPGDCRLFLPAYAVVEPSARAQPVAP